MQQQASWHTISITDLAAMTLVTRDVGSRPAWKKGFPDRTNNKFNSVLEAVSVPRLALLIGQPSWKLYLASKILLYYSHSIVAEHSSPAQAGGQTDNICAARASSVVLVENRETKQKIWS